MKPLKITHAGNNSLFCFLCSSWPLLISMLQNLVTKEIKKGAVQHNWNSCGCGDSDPYAAKLPEITFDFLYCGRTGNTKSGPTLQNYLGRSIQDPTDISLDLTSCHFSHSLSLLFNIIKFLLSIKKTNKKRESCYIQRSSHPIPGLSHKAKE